MLRLLCKVQTYFNLKEVSRMSNMDLLIKGRSKQAIKDACIGYFSNICQKEFTVLLIGSIYFADDNYMENFFNGESDIDTICVIRKGEAFSLKTRQKRINIVKLKYNSKRNLRWTILPSTHLAIGLRDAGTWQTCQIPILRSTRNGTL